MHCYLYLTMQLEEEKEPRTNKDEIVVNLYVPFLWDIRSVCTQRR